MKKFICVFSFVVFVMNACKKDKTENNNSGNNQPQAIQLDSFPLSVGYSWKYYTESHIVDSSGVNILDDYFDNYWEVVSDTIINGMVCAKIAQLDSNYNGSTHFAYTYYSNQQDGFYGMAQDNSGGLFYLRTTELAARTQFSLLGSFKSGRCEVDTVFLPDTPLHFLKFPTNINDMWLSHEYNLPLPDRIKRKWLGFNTITTIAGTFNCIKLQMFWDDNHDNQPDSGKASIVQYFSTKGLIQEELNEALSFGGGIDSLHRITKLVQVNF